MGIVSGKHVYVVFKGEKQGIYSTWQECAKMVIGVSGSLYRKYDSYDDVVEAFKDWNVRIGGVNACDESSKELSSITVADENNLEPDEHHVYVLALFLVAIVVGKLLKD